MAARAVCLAFAKELGEASGGDGGGGHQCAVGTGGGVEKLQKILAAEAEARPDAVILSLDFVNAFNSVLRSKVLEAVRKRLNDVLPVATTLCGHRARHWFFDAAGGLSLIHI